MAVKNQSTEWLIRITVWWWNAGNHSLKNLWYTDTGLGTRRDGLCRIDGQYRLDFFGNTLGVGGREVNLIDNRDDHKLSVHRKICIRKGLCFHTLCSIHDEERTFACIQRTRNFIRKVDVARCVDEVHLVFETIEGGVVHPHRGHFDCDAALALNIHFVKELSLHVTFIDGLGDFKETVCKG